MLHQRLLLIASLAISTVALPVQQGNAELSNVDDSVVSANTAIPESAILQISEGESSLEATHGVEARGRRKPTNNNLQQRGVDIEVQDPSITEVVEDEVDAELAEDEDAPEINIREQEPKANAPRAPGITQKWPNKCNKLSCPNGNRSRDVPVDEQELVENVDVEALDDDEEAAEISIRQVLQDANKPRALDACGLPVIKNQKPGYHVQAREPGRKYVQNKKQVQAREPTNNNLQQRGVEARGRRKQTNNNLQQRSVEARGRRKQTNNNLQQRSIEARGRRKQTNNNLQQRDVEIEGEDPSITEIVDETSQDAVDEIDAREYLPKPWTLGTRKVTPVKPKFPKFVKPN